MIGADGQILTYNDRFVEIWDVSRQTLLTRDDRQVLAALLKKITDAADFLHYVDTMAADRDGRVIEHETRPIRVEDEKIGRVLTFRDITARVRAFTLLHESEQRFRVFADSAGGRDDWPARHRLHSGGRPSRHARAGRRPGESGRRFALALRDLAPTSGR